MKAIRKIIALLFLAVSAGALLAAPAVPVRAAGPAIPQNLLRIVQLISKCTSTNPNKAKREERKTSYENYHKLHAPPDGAAVLTHYQSDLTRLDRIVLHLRCLYLDYKFRWHWAGIWRELRLH